MHPDTLAVHAGAAPDRETGAVAPPIHLSTTFAHGPAGERVAGYEYLREGNPTQDRLEAMLAALERPIDGDPYPPGWVHFASDLDEATRKLVCHGNADRSTMESKLQIAVSAGKKSFGVGIMRVIFDSSPLLQPFISVTCTL